MKTTSSSSSVTISSFACKPTGIIKQFSKPQGILGWIIGQLMAVKNKQRSLWVISLLNIQPEDQILEIGFGCGMDIKRVSDLASKGFIAGIDHSQTMVQQAQNRNMVAIQQGRVELQCGQATTIPYPDDSFDQIFSINVAQFWENPTQVLQELHRVLKPGGLIAIAIQPRTANATEETARQIGKTLVENFQAAGLREIRLESKPLQPVSVVCVLGRK
ncbi:MAG: methyltransferase domain-containing protein [Nostocaceae cyanobacterium]|nr:methyltransferase domain-containing protein [Nostocaceae cyanobacterium]